LARVCLDLSPVVHRKVGLGSYARELATHLVAAGSHEYSAFHYDSRPPAPLPDALARLPRLVDGRSARPWRLGVALSHFSSRPMDAAFFRTDLFHATEHLLPPFQRVRTVFTFHDAIYALFPRFHLPMNRLYLGLMMPRFLKRADAIVTISECSRRDAMRLYSVPPDRIRVIYEGVDGRFRPVAEPGVIEAMRRRLGLPDRYLLSVGTIEPRKNLAALLEAVKSLERSAADRGEPALPPIVIVGKRGWLYDDFFKRLAALGMEGRVILPGYVPDEDLPAVYSGASCFVFPSLYEGFGLPPLEAMSCGAPVVCSNTSSLPEIVGDAAITVDPADTGALAAAIARVLGDADLSAGLSARGLRRAATFSWQRTASQTLQVYEGLLAPARQS
jgi:glycosyltransferase involved in cell wall biosynthesis